MQIFTHGDVDANFLVCGLENSSEAKPNYLWFLYLDISTPANLILYKSSPKFEFKS